jgi:TonB-linked SusC/RagA family outer membrane protein
MQKAAYWCRMVNGRLRSPIKRLAGVKLAVLLLTAVFFSVCAPVRAQSVSLSGQNLPLKKVFAEIKKQTDFTVFGRKELFRDAKPVTVAVQQMPLTAFLDLIMKGQPLQYRINGREIILSRRNTTTAAVSEPSGPATSPVTKEDPIMVSGTVYDAEGLPLPGASLLLKKSGGTGICMADGKFSIKGHTGDVLQISYVGYTLQEVAIAGSRPLSIRLKPLDDQLGGVVVTGIFNRRAESFTGASTKITRQELMRNGTLNVFQSLKSIDPSLNVFDNLATGSNPNKMPDIQLRGTSSFPDLKGQYTTNPNQPLFIVDGFEMTIEKVNDLNINRIESVTILKDATAKALYGSRAANGVIVIETVKVKPGELRVNYTGTFGVEMPDLSSYNLADAREKLELEKQLGAYDRPQPIVEVNYDSLYYANLREVQNGVNTYWLAQPLRQGFTHKQTVGLEAGDERLRTGLTFYAGNTEGVMKGSERKNMGGAFSVVYRHGKILFRNLFQYTGVKSANSPYGEFSEYARLNPYWRKTNEDGSIRKFLGIGPVYSESVYNPMYNATVNTSSTSEYTDVTNNTYIEWAASRSIKVVGRIGFSNTVNGSEVFYPGSHTKFLSYTGDNLFLRGSYDKGDGKASMVSSDLNMNYSKAWGRHSVFTNVGANIREDKTENYLNSAIGFPNDRMDNIIFAKQYALNGKPSGSESIDREIGALGAANYSFDNRYFADFSVRTSASSQFGSANRWGSFWAAGAGWNLHRESFLRNIKSLDLLKLRGSVGYTGSQNFNSYQAMLLYNYFVDNSYQGLLGTYLGGLSNPNLKWQEKLDYNVGVDASLWRRLNLRLDLYRSITNNLLTDITTPPSLGFDSYKANLGQIENTGLEFRVNYRMLVNNVRRQSLNLFVSGVSNKNKIQQISNSLKSLTSAQDTLSKTSNRPVIRFAEDQSLDAIWAVPSMGIDPATGKEIFVKKDGTLTELWDPADKVVVGVNQPKLLGNFGTNFEYMGFSASVVAGFRMGGQIYNQTLVDKVENAQLNYNVDKRAYYDSWKKPGDKVLFKNIGTTNAKTLATSRFVQDLSELSISAVNLGYDFYRHAFVRKMKLQRLQVMVNMNDVHKFSTVRIERGTSYPFARYGSFTVMANF